MGTNVRGWATQSGPQLPASPSASDVGRLARRARTVRRVTAVPFWGVFVSGALLVPWFALGHDSTWQVLSFLFTLPVTAVLLLVRAVPTRRFLAAVRTGPRVVQNGALAELRGENRAATVMSAIAVLVAPPLLAITAGSFAPQLVATTPATATVSRCVLQGGGGGNSPAVECDGSWVVAGRSYQGTLPVRTARPGARLAIVVRSDEPTQVFAAQSLQNTAPGIAFGVFGLAVGLAGATGLLRRCRWLGDRFREHVAAQQ